MTVLEYLSQYSENMPTWLREFDPHNPGIAADLVRHLLWSRTVYYPGSGIDGGPVAAFNSAQAAHCYIYVDYHIDQQRFLERITWRRGQGFRGYDSIAQIDLSEVDFGLGRWRPHYRPARGIPLPRIAPYGFIAIFQRRNEFDDAHGAERFAILFLAADGHAAYDALFCQNNGTPAPFCAVIQNHGFGGDWAGGEGGFGGRGPMAQIANECNIYPQFLLKDVEEGSTPAWAGYRRCVAPDGTEVEPEPMGMHQISRSLWERGASEALVP